jgi:hypothetical protein
MNNKTADPVRIAHVVLLVALTIPLGWAIATGHRTLAGTVGNAESNSTNDVARRGYVGDAACASCHRDTARSYLHTAHHLTSQPASAGAILGSFKPGANVLMISDPSLVDEGPGLYFRMEARPGGYYQTAVTGWPGALQKRSERMDVVIGSGVRGQSYLSWRGDQLFELPVSYWSDGDRWINSPGYKNGTADFSRPVDPRCLECHATYIHPQSTDPYTNYYSRHTLIMSISCEVCHGPGAGHVAKNRTRMPDPATDDLAIVNPAKLSRDRQVDLCSLCHNGFRQKEVKAAFSFLPGKSLDEYLLPDATEGVVAEVQPNVHGDQVGLLKKSRCYLSSPNMSCSTCHDVHAPERPVASYSAHCLSCHEVKSCGMAKTKGLSIANQCIDCHMPVQSTTAIVSDTVGKLIQPKLRTHWIKVY